MGAHRLAQILFGPGSVRALENGTGQSVKQVGRNRMRAGHNRGRRFAGGRVGAAHGPPLGRIAGRGG